MGRSWPCVAALGALLLIPGLALADRGDEGRGHDHGREHYDVQHGHNHYYLNRGVEVRAVPQGAVAIVHGGDHYWFHEGIWYRGYGPRLVVVAAPFGIIIPALPPFATLVVLGGAQYYYANEAYYRYRDDQRAYEVVAPPEGAPGAAPPPGYGAANSPPAAGDSLFVYPKNGQNADQQARDRYECHRWAADQTGFDPTRSDGGVAPAAALAKRADYARAQQACLEARGYTVR